MSLRACGINPSLNITAQQRELEPHGTLDFPCAGYAEHYAPAPRPGHALPWHWHEELEVIYILSGELTAETPGRRYELAAGDCIAFNAGVLHCAGTDTACEIRSIVFSPELVSGGKESVFAKKYITPLVGCHPFRAWVFDRADEGEAEAVRRFVECCRALEQEPHGYEFTVRAGLSAVCLALCRRFAPALGAAASARPNLDEARIQQMMAYIQRNYHRPLTLAGIAAAAGVGERECLRCFSKTIRTSPMQYLLKYRVMQGAEALLARPADSVAQVAAGCGFDSPSNFSQHFRRFYGCSPRQYRARSAAPCP